MLTELDHTIEAVILKERVYEYELKYSTAHVVEFWMGGQEVSQNFQMGDMVILNEVM